MSFISKLLKGYQTDKPVTVKEYIENKTLQSSKSINNIKSNSEFIEDVDISFPNLWYMFDKTDIIKNYGIQQTNYDTVTTVTQGDFTKNMNYTGTGIDIINKNIISEFEKDFTLSFWSSGDGDVFKIWNDTSDILLNINVTNGSIVITSGSTITISGLVATDYNHIVIKSLNNEATVYINGIIHSSTVTISGYTFNYTTDIITLLTSVKYADMRVFNKALSDDKILSLYNIGNNITTDTFIITVDSSAYLINGVTKPILNLKRNTVYTFDLSDSSNNGHPFAFRNSDDTSYTTGVVSSGTAGTAGAKTVFTVPNDAPNSLKYYCTVHTSSMGNTINVEAAYPKIISNTHGTVDLNAASASTVSFWVNCSDANVVIISFTDFECGVKDKRFYIKCGNRKVFSNRKLDVDSKYYFITFVIENESSSIKLYVDNFPAIGKKIKDPFVFSNFTFTFAVDIIEDLLVYNVALSDSEIMDLYIADVKRKTVNADLNSVPVLFADYPKTDEKVYDLSFKSLYPVYPDANAGTVGVSGSSTGSYVLKLPEAAYGGYTDHINDLVIWYKFEKTPNGELRNYGFDSTYYGIINNSGIAKPELVFTPSSDKYSMIQLDNKLDKFHIIDTNDKNSGGADSVTYTVTPLSNLNVDILIVGGGGGGVGSGGGGGDIEYVENYTLLSNNEYTFKVGKGGSMGYVGGVSEMLDSTRSIYKVLGGGSVGGVGEGSGYSGIKIRNVSTFESAPASVLSSTPLTSSFIVGTDDIIGPFDINVDDTDYILYTFKYNADYTSDSQTSYELTFSKETVCDILVVGGGGGGGGSMGGGGGGGSVIYATGISVPANTYNILVGKGGTGGVNQIDGTNGFNSIIFGATAIGGGRGGDYNISNSESSGGSGGGEGGGGDGRTGDGVAGLKGVNTIPNTSLLFTNYQYYVNNGGDAFYQNVANGQSSRGGGGGGAGTAGGAGGGDNTDRVTQGIGGDGIPIPIIQPIPTIQTNLYYGAGGGGGPHKGNLTEKLGKAGGLGGGGNGGNEFSNGTKTDGIDGTGYGAGGGGGAYQKNAGNGGSGIVIIRYKKEINIPPTASATSAGGLVLTNPLSNISPLVPIGKGYSGGDYYYLSNIDGIVTYAGGGGGAGSAGFNATSSDGGKGGSGLFYSITTLNVEYCAGGSSVSMGIVEPVGAGNTIFRIPTDIEKLAETTTGVKGWKQVGHLPSETTRTQNWYPNDFLKGGITTSTVNVNNLWTKSFTGKDEVLFVKNNFERWAFGSLTTINTSTTTTWYQLNATTSQLKSDGGRVTKLAILPGTFAPTDPFILLGTSYDASNSTGTSYNNGEEWMYMESSSSTTEIGWYKWANSTYDVFVRDSTKTYAEPVVIPNTDYKYLAFPYVPDVLEYDFTNENTETTWRAKADGITGFTYSFTSWFDSGGHFISGDGKGYIEYILPITYNKLTVSFGNVNTASTVTLLINGVVKLTATAGQYLTYTQPYNAGDILRIEEYIGIMNPDLVITLTSTQTEYSVTFDEPDGTECDILIVGGGGGGGSTHGGGGGAGGLIYETGLSLKGQYNILVGKEGLGGTGGTNNANNPGFKGKNSQIIGGLVSINKEAIGGGGGGSGYPNEVEPVIGGGGSSGGLGSGDSAREAGNIHITGQGNTGGISVEPGNGQNGYNMGPGGGGGSDGVGGNGVGYVAGAGGNGREIPVTGTLIRYAGGGGGGSNQYTAGAGGQGGGGAGASNGKGTDGTYYGGGGGGGGGSWGAGGNGGSGIVIIRYKTTKSSTSTTTTTSTPYKPPAVLKYLTTTKWQPIINPTSTSDFSMTLDLTSSNFDTTTNTYTTYFDMEHSNIYNKNTDNYRVILNASVDDGDNYVLSTLYYNENPLFFEYCNITPTTDWSYSNLTIGDSKKLRISVITDNQITKINVKM